MSCVSRGGWASKSREKPGILRDTAGVNVATLCPRSLEKRVRSDEVLLAVFGVEDRDDQQTRVFVVRQRGERCSWVSILLTGDVYIARKYAGKSDEFNARTRRSKVVA